MRCQQFFANTLLTLYGAYSGILTYFTCFLFDINYHPLSENFFQPDDELVKNVKKTSHPIKKSANPPRHPSRTPCNQLVLPAETSWFHPRNKLFSPAKQVILEGDSTCFRWGNKWNCYLIPFSDLRHSTILCLKRVFHSVPPSFVAIVLSQQARLTDKDKG